MTRVKTVEVAIRPEVAILTKNGKIYNIFFDK